MDFTSRFGMIIKFIVCWDTGYNLHFRHTGRCSGQSDIAKTTLASSLHFMILIPHKHHYNRTDSSSHIFKPNCYMVNYSGTDTEIIESYSVTKQTKTFF